MTGNSKQETVRIINPRNQPVELHFDNTCIVVQPKQHIDCSDHVVHLPQIRYLLTKKYLLVRPMGAKDTGMPGAEASAAGKHTKSAQQSESEEDSAKKRKEASGAESAAHDTEKKGAARKKSSAAAVKPKTDADARTRKK